ncbi:MAG: 50S ribosome-binding GTPase [Synergistaceae bacterium]|nr:50S ribosome-binding GTPase [Synergistaceae bacterium]MBQ6114095.1 50S ribosome-binding GTPase [Synergistaceae bacterium]MBQ6419330.1 50S ribosome-binding GTPase [Synergistaceae bacterium]
MLSQYRIKDIEDRVKKMQAQPLDVMLIGATGSGKSTTLNGLFGSERAKVGHGFDPETMNISEHRLNELLNFWDTPGLGDSANQDKEHVKKIVDKLRETYTANKLPIKIQHIPLDLEPKYFRILMNEVALGKDYGLIDLVLVVIDGSTRDLGTVYTLFVDVLLPNIQADRILTVINQCDMAMSGRHWDYSRNVPDSTLLDFLNDQVRTITRRISETTGKNIIPPVYYSAEYGYNIERVLDLIIDHIPLERRKI